METIPIIFNEVTYNIPIPIAEGWCKVLTKITGTEITLKSND